MAAIEQTQRETPGMDALFADFTERRAQIADGTTFRLLSGGEGPVVLLLHGWPQTLAAWHRIAPQLRAAGYRVVVPDLPGYGQGEIGSGSALARAPSRRAIAGSIATLMESLGHQRYAVVGHDRGARAGYRLALDRPDPVAGYASLAVVPTLDVWERIDGRFALRAPHWFFFTLPPDLLETLIGAGLDGYLDHVLTGMAGGRDRLDPRAVADYRAAFARPAVRAAMFSDYSAALGIDLEHERADRETGHKIACPVLHLWPAGVAGDPLAVWRRWADDVSGGDVAGGHLLPEQSADAVLEALIPFLKRCFPR
ncbi:alpha/beta fold hydrolase [Chelatococcus asaccharovorans]|uniref:alpha/beta fold hydrolase n=1 Tax=Chelatococcus asaccharovorans TaxID=28210 RepID=UPI00224C792D|nr:alpha/beta hydrolase [Chelatococcus asaccharovorans]CAH1672478.1 Fluoroacetate dehalogenase [Chelatococcus asaccharovorans]CAH1676105.1 Fluoroacetate dehalogenase [Chelatococcus asaccharovorans]